MDSEQIADGVMGCTYMTTSELTKKWVLRVFNRKQTLVNETPEIPCSRYDLRLEVWRNLDDENDALIAALAKDEK